MSYIKIDSFSFLFGYHIFDYKSRYQKVGFFCFSTYFVIIDNASEPIKANNGYVFII